MEGAFIHDEAVVRSGAVSRARGGAVADNSVTETEPHDEERPSPSSEIMLDRRGNDEQSKKNMAMQALQSIQYCSKMCFVFVVSDAIMTVAFDPYSRSKVFLGSILNRLSILVLGGGLRRTSQLYAQSMNRESSNILMESDNLIIYSSFFGLWRGCGESWR
mmetsp:Transcript_6603/g.11716  ORF Transcript_6603/g.11716 Transcript_6603/m.11716 type:complete len:161 (-) Transcript_6603:225-707(-)